jgi:hypothetical protein
MQSWSWYARRLRHMSAAELAWRAQSSARDAADRVRVGLGLHRWDNPPAPGSYPAQLTSLPLQLHSGPLPPASPEVRALQAAADDITAHRLSFFNLERVDLGAEIDWNRDYESGTAAPLGYAGAIDYRDARVAGDAKLVWEPSRHLQLTVLGRAYRATGRDAYAREGLKQIESWIAQCPFGIGMQWRSPLELAIRAINWTWFLALVAPSGLLHGPVLSRLLHTLDAHVHDITRKYSRGSSANNHRIGEACGVFVACACLPLTNARERVATSARILEEEIQLQHFEDGGNREQAFGYHLFVLQFLLVAAYTARCTGHSLSRAYLDRFDRMLDFVDEVTAAGPAPMYGDADDGYVLDLGGRDRGGREWLGPGDCLLGRAPREAAEPVTWLFPGAAQPAAPHRRLHSRDFPDTGLYLLQWGDSSGRDAVSMTVDCGPLGFGPLAAHGHADALGVTLRAFGEDVFVDPGTYDYFRYPGWRDYFRSTRAHNTIVIDGVDQSVMLGPFMWGARATARCVSWTHDAAGARLVGEHDGYERLPDPVRHRRAVEMRSAERTFIIRDTLTMTGHHRIEMAFHVSERATVRRLGGHRFEIVTPGGSVELIVDARTEPSLVEAGTEQHGGWVSRGYHRRSPAATIVASMTSSGPVELESRMLVGMPR